jgi:8-oxo-dGTP pyrophosphatase MutT (NUDIX family)
VADAAAARELTEETGLALPLTPVPDASPSDDVALYVAEASLDAEIVLDDEPDRFLWLRSPRRSRSAYRRRLKRPGFDGDSEPWNQRRSHADPEAPFLEAIPA